MRLKVDLFGAKYVARGLGITTGLIFSFVLAYVIVGPGVLDASATPAHIQQRKPCDEYYPIPENYQNWHCHQVGGAGSACGGPEQCECDISERLVVFECDKGTYKQCYGEKGNGCKGY